MNVIFTDIDGVLNPLWGKKWSKKSVHLYNKLCEKFDLKPVITSTWRTAHNKDQLQNIFIEQGISIEIYDYTPILNKDRGIEIKEWLNNNNVSNYAVLDDKVSDIYRYVSNIVECRSWVGFTEEEYELACEFFS